LQLLWSSGVSSASARPCAGALLAPALLFRKKLTNLEYGRTVGRRRHNYTNT